MPKVEDNDYEGIFERAAGHPMQKEVKVVICSGPDALYRKNHGIGQTVND